MPTQEVMASGSSAAAGLMALRLRPHHRCSIGDGAPKSAQACRDCSLNSADSCRRLIGLQSSSLLLPPLPLPLPLLLLLLSYQKSLPGY
jgi:hypothetical protein